MNLSAIDIRLLLVFKALMRERSVSRAAQEVGMSQPAVSRALNTLRGMLKDDLFVRSAGEMTPTTKAIDLIEPVHDVLARLQSIFEPPDFDPATAERTFRLAVSDHCATVVLPRIEEYLRTAAPGVELRIRPKIHTAVCNELDTGEIDFALGSTWELPPRLKEIVLFSEPYVCVMRQEHPAAGRPLRYDEYVAAEHLSATHSGEVTQALDTVLRKKGVKRKIAITINQVLLAAEVLTRSDLILTTHLQTARRLQSLANLHLADVPFATAPLVTRLIWHGGLATHPAHEWLRNTVIQIGSALRAEIDQLPPTRSGAAAK